MELHQLRYFISIVETGSFSKAARRCHIAQPSLSQQIIKLERELKSKLFDRLGNKVVLTEAGTALLPRAKRIMQEALKVKADIADERSIDTGCISVGFITTIAPYLLPESLKKFKKKFPNADIKVYENLTENLVEKLIAFEIDIAVMSLPIENALVGYNELFIDPLLLSVPKSFKLSKQKKVSINDLKNVSFIELDEQHCLGEQIKGICYQQQMTPDTVCKTWNISTILNCVATGTGIAIIPLMTALTNKSKSYVYKKLSENPSRAVVSVFYKKRTRKELIIEFEKIIVEVYKDLIHKNPKY